LQDDQRKLERERAQQQRKRVEASQMSLPSLAPASSFNSEPSASFSDIDLPSSLDVAFSCSQAATACSRTADLLDQIDAVLQRETAARAPEIDGQIRDDGSGHLLRWAPMTLIATERKPVTMQDMFG